MSTLFLEIFLNDALIGFFHGNISYDIELLTLPVRSKNGDVFASHPVPSPAFQVHKILQQSIYTRKTGMFLFSPSHPFYRLPGSKCTSNSSCMPDERGTLLPIPPSPLLPSPAFQVHEERH